MLVQGKYGSATIHTDKIEDSALKQIYDVCNSPVSLNSTIHIMPDVHAGAGVPIGFTQRLDSDDPRISPNLVSVDIGCRVSAIELKNCKKIDFESLDKFIRDNIPIGAGNYDTNSKLKDRMLKLVTDEQKEVLIKAEEMVKIDGEHSFKTSVLGQLFSLGSGNHYIEIDVSDAGVHWLNVHSGSRNFGLTVANIYQDKAVEYSGEGCSKDLCFLDKGSKHFDRYLYCVNACQMFSQINHNMMLSALWSHIFKNDSKNCFKQENVITTLHNYIDLDNMIIRKGAISAQSGEKVLIPFNMRDGIGIFVGKGNEDYNFSAPHGCGRLMSRGQAKKSLDLDRVRQEMKDANVFTTSLDYALDEAADAYKDINFILDNVSETVDLVEILKPVYNIKGK